MVYIKFSRVKYGLKKKFLLYLLNYLKSLRHISMNPLRFYLMSYGFPDKDKKLNFYKNMDVDSPISIQLKFEPLACPQEVRLCHNNTIASSSLMESFVRIRGKYFD